MNKQNFFPESSSSLWIQHLIHGLSGLLIKTKQCLFCSSSPFQKVEVFDTYAFGRVLCLGGNIVLTENEDVYDEMMVHPAMFMHDNPKTVCCIGGGDGGCLKEILKHPSVEKIVIVEIDELVQKTIKQYFRVLAQGFEDPRVELIFDDGYNFLKNCKQQFDIIFVDSYDPGGPVQSLETTDFHQVVSERLHENGVVVFQTDSPTIREYYLRSTISSVSPFLAYYKTYISSIRSFPNGICSFLVCAQEEKILDHFDEKRYTLFINKGLTSYYNSDIHRGAFLLPQNIKNITHC
jgi:spermidine synthase